MKNQQRTIMLVDMQSFYASVEKAANPQYKDRPLVVSGDPARRTGIILAACPLAKQYGVTTAETLGQALGKCPDLVVIRPRMQLYIDVSLQITDILQSFSDLVEPYSIDEQFVEITQSQHLFGPPEHIAKLIQSKIMRETGVYARAGISYCKVVAKMACDNFAKKNKTGIFTLPKEDLERVLWPLPIQNMFLIGSRMTRHLYMMGIQTIGDLAKTPLAALKARWGVNGEVIWRIANGLDDSPVSLNAHEQQKGIGHQMTLPRDYAKLEEIYVVIMELSELVCERARRQGKMGKVVAVGVQGSDFDNPQGFYRQRKLDTPTNITKKVYEAARALFKEHWDHKEGRYAVRKVGVTLQDLVPADVYQLDLFEDLPKITALEQTTDALKDRYGETVIMRASSLTEAGQIRDRSRKIGGHYK